MREEYFLRNYFLMPDGSNFDDFAEMARNFILGLKNWWKDPRPNPSMIDRYDPNVKIPDNLCVDPYNILRGLLERLKGCRRLNAKRFGLAPPPLLPSLIASFLTSIQNPNNLVDGWGKDDWEKSESEQVTPNLERECIKMMAEMVGYRGEKARGNLVSGGTIAILSALLVARDKKYGERAVREGLFNKNIGKVITTKSAHYSIPKALRILGMGENNLIEIPVHTDEDVQNFLENGKPFPLRPNYKILEEELKKLDENNIPIIAVIPTLGTVETGTIEPVRELVSLKKQYNFFLHVDAAIGGYALLLNDIREMATGIEESDAVNIDPHKLGYIHYPCGAIIFSNEDDYELLRYEAPYLREISPTIEGSRSGAPAAACWIALKTLGKEGYSRIIGERIRITKYLAEKLESEGYQVLHEVHLNIVCFSLKGNFSRGEINELNKKLYEEINKRNKFRVAYLRDLSGIMIREKDGKHEYPITGLRLVVLNPFMDEAIIDEFIKELNEVRNKILSNV